MKSKISCLLSSAAIKSAKSSKYNKELFQSASASLLNGTVLNDVIVCLLKQAWRWHQNIRLLSILWKERKKPQTKKGTAVSFQNIHKTFIPNSRNCFSFNFLLLILDIYFCQQQSSSHAPWMKEDKYDRLHHIFLSDKRENSTFHGYTNSHLGHSNESSCYAWPPNNLAIQARPNGN